MSQHDEDDAPIDLAAGEPEHEGRQPLTATGRRRFWFAFVAVVGVLWYFGTWGKAALLAIPSAMLLVAVLEGFRRRIDGLARVVLASLPVVLMIVLGVWSGPYWLALTYLYPLLIPHCMLLASMGMDVTRMEGGASVALRASTVIAVIVTGAGCAWYFGGLFLTGGAVYIFMGGLLFASLYAYHKLSIGVPVAMFVVSVWLHAKLSSGTLEDAIASAGLLGAILGPLVLFLAGVLLVNSRVMSAMNPRPPRD